jgi:CRISPR-associated exonuclease Cas4
VTRGGFLLFILAAIAGLMAWKMARSSRARAVERHWLPRELQHAQLAFAEKTFRMWQPIRVIARADRGYRLKGELYLAEFKTRSRAVAYSSDVIELSAQRLAIEATTRERVSEIGYVLAQDPLGKRRSVHKVRLLPMADVIAVARRREAILKGRVVPTYTGSRGLCIHCAYRPECKPELQYRGQRPSARNRFRAIGLPRWHSKLAPTAARFDTG